MIDFEGCYLLDGEKIEYVRTRNGAGEAPYGLFLHLKNGQELGVWYRTEASREQAREKMATIIRNEWEDCARGIIDRLYIVETSAGDVEQAEETAGEAEKHACGRPTRRRKRIRKI